MLSVVWCCPVVIQLILVNSGTESRVPLCESEFVPQPRPNFPNSEPRGDRCEQRKNGIAVCTTNVRYRTQYNPSG